MLTGMINCKNAEPIPNIQVQKKNLNFLVASLIFRIFRIQIRLEATLIRRPAQLYPGIKTMSNFKLWHKQ